jgi:primary-amine oxidase
MLKPVGFFDGNPALDMPRSTPACHSENGSGNGHLAGHEAGHEAGREAGHEAGAATE